MSVLVISFLTILFLLQIFLPKTQLNRAGFLILIFAIALVFGFAGFNSWQQYQAWQLDPAAKFLLPPYQDWNYFVFHVRYNFFNPYLISLLMGLLFFLGAKKLNKKYEERFFEPIEPYLLMTSMFLLGTPGWLAYLFVFFIIYFILNLLFTLFYFLLDKFELQKYDHVSSSGLTRGSSNFLSIYWIPHQVRNDTNVRGNDNVNTPIIQGKKEMPRIPLFYLWLPVAISTIILEPILIIPLSALRF